VGGVVGGCWEKLQEIMVVMMNHRFFVPKITRKEWIWGDINKLGLI